MSSVEVSAHFTESGAPATGLTLTDINFYLVSRKLADDTITVIWDGTQHPTVEVTTVGDYARTLTGADFSAYSYHGMAYYAGTASVDALYVNGVVSGVALASDGLDAIPMTAPAGVASNFREMMVQIWRRLFRKVTMTSTQVKTYADDGSTVLTTQSVSDDGSTQTQGGAS